MKSNFSNHEDNFTISENTSDSSIAFSSQLEILVRNDCKNNMFQRRAMKGVLGNNPEYKTMLVVELENGIRIYIKGNKIVVTKENLRL